MFGFLFSHFLFYRELNSKGETGGRAYQSCSNMPSSYYTYQLLFELSFHRKQRTWLPGCLAAFLISNWTFQEIKDIIFYMQMSLSFCLFPTESDSAHLSNEEAACQLNANSSLMHQKHYQKHLRSVSQQLSFSETIFILSQYTLGNLHSSFLL